MPSRTKLILVGLCCTAVGIAIGLLFDAWSDTGSSAPDAFSEMREGGELLINPLLECDSAKASLRKRELKPFEDELEKIIQRTRASLKLVTLSAYFRELNDGLWFEIGDVEHYAPVSLLKLPLMIAVFRQEEQSPGFLKRTVLFDSPVDMNEIQSIKPARTLRRGGSYSVEELVRRMIVYSDNNAFTLLEGVVDPEIYKRLYSNLGINMAFLEQQDYRISAKEFATFVRVLYNASYLGREMSERGMELLTQTDFRRGIVAGVPEEITVAHKFGEGGEQGVAELHDCGIVYYPQHPYVLCIMSRGRDVENLQDALGTVSRAVFDAVDDQHTLDRRRRAAATPR